ncbi:MAG TPA: hypothetical protein VMS35_06525 [Nitrososphaeraceae archaeon]|nr:hypothetical protein [Nitrososphaeraceae archaeon]
MKCDNCGIKTGAWLERNNVNLCPKCDFQIFVRHYAKIYRKID